MKGRITQVLFQALLYLVAAVIRGVTWARTDRYSLGVLDEAWALTHTVEGHHLLEEGLRDGRKDAAGMIVAGQDPGDLGNLDNPDENKLAPLMCAFRMVFPFEHRDAASRGLRLIDLDGDPAGELIGMLSAGNPKSREQGQCLLRDAKGRIGRVAVAVGSRRYKLAAASEVGMP